MFQNHEILKISDYNTLLSAILIYAGLAAASFCFIKKTSDNSFLNRNITEQIRGIAILFVVVGHIGVHILAAPKSWLVLSDYGVAIFFLLSGFGLARSYMKKKMVIKDFIVRRLARVMIPYCIATFTIIFLDYIILNRLYSLKTIILTFCGINFSTIAKHIDYVRWYITVLIIWYLFFAVYWKKFSGRIFAIAFLATAFILIILNYYFVPFGYAFLSFPCGILLGIFYDNEVLILHKYNNPKTLLMVSLAGLVLPYVLSGYLFSQIENNIPYISIVFAKEFLWVCFASSMLLFFHSISAQTSIFLKFIGKYSYEIFLFHGVFMIKYDFILFKGPLYLTFWPYFIFILLISIITQKIIFNKIQRHIEQWV